MDDYAEIDLSEQIDNPWSKDTALAIAKGNINYSIKIIAKDKGDLKNIFYKTGKSRINRRNNRKGVVIIYSFLLYYLLRISNGLSNRVKICNDVRPTRSVNHYLTIICNFHKVSPIQREIKLDFKKRKKKKSKAHDVAKAVAHGRISANITLSKNHIEKLKHIIKINLNL
ncbi:hypothetical protein GOV12_00725 [Candidatus Pacearchaeota archaeon]|nr:hypothetical protein [Candidatus Pacearchaeota archaeon]